MVYGSGIVVDVVVVIEVVVAGVEVVVDVTVVTVDEVVLFEAHPIADNAANTATPSSTNLK